jgi:hypothetical protein
MVRSADMPPVQAVRSSECSFVAFIPFEYAPKYVVYQVIYDRNRVEPSIGGYLRVLELIVGRSIAAWLVACAHTHFWTRSALPRGEGVCAYVPASKQTTSWGKMDVGSFKISRFAVPCAV